MIETKALKPNEDLPLLQQKPRIIWASIGHRVCCVNESSDFWLREALGCNFLCQDIARVNNAMLTNAFLPDPALTFFGQNPNIAGTCLPKKLRTLKNSVSTGARFSMAEIWKAAGIHKQNAQNAKLASQARADPVYSVFVLSLRSWSTLIEFGRHQLIRLSHGEKRRTQWNC